MCGKAGSLYPREARQQESKNISVNSLGGPLWVEIPPLTVKIFTGGSVWECHLSQTARQVGRYGAGGGTCETMPGSDMWECRYAHARMRGGESFLERMRDHFLEQL